MQTIRRGLLSALGAFIFLSTSIAFASPAQADSGWSSRLTTGYLVSTDADFDSGGTYSSRLFFIDGSTRKSFANHFSIGLGLNYTTLDYDFKDFGVNPWDRADFLTISVPVTMKAGESGRLSVAGSFGSATEKNASWDEGWTSSLVLSYMYFFSPALSIGTGAGFVHGLEDSSFFPLILVRWQITDQWLLSNPFRPGPFGPAGLELSYRHNDRLDFGLGGVYRSIRFALDDQAPVAPSGFAEFKGVPVFLRLGWAATRSIAVDGYFGLTLDGRLTIDDSEGNELRKEKYDPQPIVGVNLSGRF
ncbi:hypothetical protein [Desulfobulbus alkaliphilus]|uniref:hypothetical protein n=1 Tax=Desulfobulbus alkaliphilus TaxID=869814 RepID=UPI001963C815|nr:hypothetical protein [Desulfobulbus alkaliphilus]MBM9536114.1 hypothetical protein [Desulfobulbus alkaliphilus]